MGLLHSAMFHKMIRDAHDLYGNGPSLFIGILQDRRPKPTNFTTILQGDDPLIGSKYNIQQLCVQRFCKTHVIMAHSMGRSELFQGPGHQLANGPQAEHGHLASFGQRSAPTDLHGPESLLPYQVEPPHSWISDGQEP